MNQTATSQTDGSQDLVLDGAKRTTVDLTLEELLPFALGLHREGRLDSALQCYETFLQHKPNDANATHFLGVVKHQRGDRQAALELIKRSLAMDPGVAPWHNNLGNMLLDDGQFDAAALSYMRCIELDAGNIEVLNNLGVLYRRLGRFEEAEAVLVKAIASEPKFVDAHHNLITLYCESMRFEKAFSILADVLVLGPKNSTTSNLQVLAYAKAGRMEEALHCCREWVNIEPGNPKALHFFAALGGTQPPPRASDAYIEFEFNAFAASFDAKLASLGYQAPRFVGEAVAQRLGAPEARLDILDAGCGTGLCATYLRPFARQLVGVDLSANMLKHAEEKGGYDKLVHAELVAYLQGMAESFDVVVSADTLCYFGQLNDAFAAVRSSLRAGGHWVFTVEGHEMAQDYKLHTHGRYSHARAYLETELSLAGFGTRFISQVVLRMEGGVPVSGWLVCAS
jgi:predicted TPR repeat methyltransferase